MSTLIMMNLPLGTDTSVSHAMVNPFKVEAIREVVGAGRSFLHSDVYMRSGKVWQTPLNESEVLIQMHMACNGPYADAESLPDQPAAPIRVSLLHHPV